MSTETDAKPQLYCAWFCPFAQRAWMALIHRGVDFEYVEQNPYNKTPEWLEINPRGLVPTIRHKGKCVYESSICMEYIDETWPTQDKAKSFFPKDTFERAYVRMWSDFIAKKIVPFYYRVLMSQDEAEQQRIKETILTNMDELQGAMSSDGPFFMGETFGFADLMLAPYAQRFNIVTKIYRDFEIPNTDQFKRYHTWWKAVQEVHCYKATAQPDKELIESYERYSTGKAKTQVADAVRKNEPLP